MRSNVLLAIVIGLALVLAACENGRLAEMRQQVGQQKAQIEQQQRELEQMRAQQQQQAINATLPPPGSCDDAVMHKALSHGDELYAAGNYQVALGYYQDAAKACPGNAQPELSLARVYEAMGNRSEAVHHYQLALNAAEANSVTADRARQGMMRLNAAR